MDMLTTEHHLITPVKAEKSFEMDLRELPLDVRNRYEFLYLDLRLKQAKKNYGKPAGHIPLEKRQDLVLIAKTTESDEEAKKALEMQESWDKATSRDGRPPIAGAQDD